MGLQSLCLGVVFGVLGGINWQRASFTIRFKDVAMVGSTLHGALGLLLSGGLVVGLAPFDFHGVVASQRVQFVVQLPLEGVPHRETFDPKA